VTTFQVGFLPRARWNIANLGILGTDILENRNIRVIFLLNFMHRMLDPENPYYNSIFDICRVHVSEGKYTSDVDSACLAILFHVRWYDTFCMEFWMKKSHITECIY